jgi:hypothetical protein
MLLDIYANKEGKDGRWDLDFVARKIDCYIEAKSLEL